MTPYLLPPLLSIYYPASIITAVREDGEDHGVRGVRGVRGGARGVRGGARGVQ